MTAKANPFGRKPVSSSDSRVTPSTPNKKIEEDLDVPSFLRKKM